jgi:energy-coupling factor transporter ATP-binding protein EcfA2
MASVDSQIQSADRVITKAIGDYEQDRAFLSQIVLAQLRNLIEGIAVRIHTNDGTTEFDYRAIEAGLAYARSTGQLSQLRRFHGFITISASHYTFEGDPSERLMLKYYEHLLRLRSLAKSRCGLDILANLEDFPVDLDPALREYHEKIASRIDDHILSSASIEKQARYYIQNARPFFVEGRIYYEVTFSMPVDRMSKTDRIIAFTDIDITTNYAARLTLVSDSIQVLGKTMPIMIIRAWEVSIRPCEFDNFSRLLGKMIKANTGNNEYRSLMNHLTSTASTLLDLIDLPDHEYEQVKATILQKALTSPIFGVLDKARNISMSKSPGYNVVRYLMLQMNNRIIKEQFSNDECGRLSDLRVDYGCVPFDTMPFCTSLKGHNPRFSDLAESLDVSGRTHELLARRVKNNIENRGILYTPVSELEDLGDVSALIAAHNNKLYFKHRPTRDLVLDKSHVFVQGYEDGTVAIIKKMQEFASSGVAGYSVAVEAWLTQNAAGIDDPLKESALKELFAQSKVAVIYGAAGTGKSTMVDHIANYFNAHSKLFLAQTNPAIDNLSRRVNAQNTTFRTIASQLRRSDDTEYDVLFIDECSTVSNDDLLQLMGSTSFKLMVLVGDIFQIESIRFGNWFEIVSSFVPASSVFELTTPFRTKNPDLLDLWSKVRNTDDDIVEALASNGYSSVLDGSLFQAQEKDEIILCLNYDGLYGINNINRFLQSSNTGTAVTWGVTTYKVGDPVLFGDSERFKPLIYNNLKGRIVNISASMGKVTFDIELDRPVTELDTWQIDDLILVENSTVRFDVFESGDGDEDGEQRNATVPFQVAYAVSIHKAQGLEYDSVKVVITDANEEDVTHSIFYTAITRAREKLRVFWTPETQQSILAKLNRSSNLKDVALLSARRGLRPN